MCVTRCGDRAFLATSLMHAVTPSEAPQSGVKRPLQGNPVGIPNNLPAFRGRGVEPAGSIKVPKLTQGNRPNEGTNVAIPYSRVCPLEFLSGWTGRLAPGDVSFIMKYPPGFLSTQPNFQNGTNGTATMARVIGLDGLNRLLHGESNPLGWRVNANVLYLNDDKDHFIGHGKANSPLDLKVEAKHNDTWTGTRWRLDVLDTTRLDGVVKSNDEPDSFTSSGSRDAVIFNTVIQGPTLVNNGYLLYDPNANPSYNSNSNVNASRTVEAHARGSIEGGYHIGGSGRPGLVGSQTWLEGGQYDYVAAFTGTYTTYPGQMFDRHVQPMNSLYVGLRAYEMSVEKKMLMTRDDGSLVFENATDAKTAKCYFYQYMPFASSKAWICQNVKDEINKGIKPGVNNNGYMSRESTLNTINSTLAMHNMGSKASRFDDDMFDAVRSVDLEYMVGAWHVGRVLDVKAQRHTAYAGGPSDTGFSLMVDVQVGWRDANPQKSGSRDPTQAMDDKQIIDNLGGYSSREAGVWKQMTAQDFQSFERRSVDTHNAQNTSMTNSVGAIFGSEFTTLSIYQQRAEMMNTISARWPQINASTGQAFIPIDWNDDTCGSEPATGTEPIGLSTKTPLASQNNITPIGSTFNTDTPVMDAVFSAAPTADPVSTAAPVSNAAPFSTAAPVASTAAPVATGAAAASTAASVSTAAPVEIAAPAASTAVPVSTAAPATSTAAPAPASATPARASATGASAAARKRVVKSPARTRGTSIGNAVSVGTTASANAVGTTREAPMEAGVPLGAGASAPLLPTMTNPSTGTRRKSGDPSTVSSVFDSIFGSGLEQQMQGTAKSLGSAPASPTPSSGSEHGTGMGSKTFRHSRPR